VAAWWTGFWDYLGPREQEAVTALARRRTFGAQETILHESEPSDHIFVLVTGWVKVTVVDSGGREVILALRGPGDIVGEMEALIDDPRRSASVRTLNQPVTALILPSRTFRQFLDEYPAAWLALYKVLAFRLRESNRNAREYGRVGVRQALARVIVDLATRIGSKDSLGRLEVSLLSQDELAASIWSSRDAVAHEIQDLRRRGILGTGRRSFTVLDPQKLRSLAQSGEY
jgi:CRP/FNR family transcriptional regulator, cyclic AMP receptor protein